MSRNTTATMSTGRTSGRVTIQKVCHGLAPYTRAASKGSTGSVRAVTDRGLFSFQAPAGSPDPYRLQVAHFGECIRAGRTPLVDGSEGARDLAVCLAVYEAARERSVVRI